MQSVHTQWHKDAAQSAGALQITTEVVVERGWRRRRGERVEEEQSGRERQRRRSRQISSYNLC